MKRTSRVCCSSRCGRQCRENPMDKSTRRIRHNNGIAEIGARYGKLTVIRFSHRDHRSHAFWVCLCDCGKEVITRASPLVHGRTNSCGCMRGRAPKGSRTPDRDGVILTLVQKGRSFSDSGALLGVSRNTVAGVVFRARNRNKVGNAASAE